MKQNKLNILAASLIAAFAANVAYAGNVASSNPQLAREVVTSDTQVVLAPEASYAFQGDLNTVSQIQTIQVQLTLTGGGKWKDTATVLNSIQLFEANGTTLIAPVAAVTPTVSADGKTLFATLTYAVDGLVHKTPVLSFNRVGVTQSSLTELFTVVGTVAECDTASKQLPFTVKHFTGVAPGSTTLAVNGINGAFEDESARNGANNNNVLMTFPTNINLGVVASTGAAKVNPANQFRFNAPLAADATTQSVTLANLGSVSLKQQANGYDSNFANVYNVGTTLVGAATATTNAGLVEATDVKVVVNATQGFAVGSTVFLSLLPNCSTTLPGTSVTVTGTTGNTVTLPITTANLAALYGKAAAVAAAPFPAFAAQTAQVCYDVTAATTVVTPSVFSGVATLTKAAGTLPFPEQNNFCKGPLFALASGVKIDVRNYATAATNSGWLSVIRLINPSETNTAVVYGQLIHADGKYGNWGQIATLAPRAVVNMNSAEINPLLNKVPTTVTPGAGGPVDNGGSKAGDRLRVTADGVGSLRVQNYLYNPASQNFIEASSSQAVDFDGTVDRAPVNEGQYQSQDAQTGLKK
ncbi:hypothetical protein [Undibacterium sp. Ren11W]|uniref:hypothetical protein n=1 Tax=Undibacterium sp. Ren11W TaxID=3413045 RepID=UPI003BF4450A